MISAMLILLSLLFLLPTAFSKSFQNPVIPNEDNADPGAIEWYSAYYVATSPMNETQSGTFPLHRSTDLQNWTSSSYIFPAGYAPSWADGSFSAPEVHYINDSYFVAYFVAKEASSGVLCVGAAHSDHILGPYLDIGAPLIKNVTVGSIDPNFALINFSVNYILWKEDGNANTPQTPSCIWIQQLSNDGLKLLGDKTQLFCNTLAWEGDSVGAPWMLQRGNWYYVFYSGFSSDNSSYAVGVARSKNILGPYEKKGDPILKSNSEWIGPGHCSVVQDFNTLTDKYVMIYHAWQQGQVGQDYPRLMMADYMTWGLDNWPSIKGDSPSSGIDFTLIQ